MPQLSDDQLAQLAYGAGFRGQVLVDMVAIALRESRGNSDAVGDKDNPKRGCGSFGLWQINSCPGYGAGAPRYSDNPTALLDPATNAAAAFMLSKNGTWLQPWTSYRSGIPSFQPFSARAKAAVDKLGGASGGVSNPSAISGAKQGIIAGMPDAGGGLEVLTSSSTWLRVASFAGGVTLALAALALILGDTAVDVADKVT